MPREVCARLSLPPFFFLKRHWRKTCVKLLPFFISILYKINNKFQYTYINIYIYIYLYIYLLIYAILQRKEKRRHMYQYLLFIFVFSNFSFVYVFSNLVHFIMPKHTTIYQYFYFFSMTQAQYYYKYYSNFNVDKNSAIAFMLTITHYYIF